MKLHYSKILLFFLPLNILVTLYQANTNNKPSIITPHHIPMYTSRVLSECDTESSIYDNDEDMESVKEIFERQTSQRLREYDERLQVKRQKRKEQRDKNIQKIIQKDKMEKNVAEKIEKGCLMCGCGLGSVAGSVGLFGGIAINIWKTAALKAAIAEALEANHAMISAAAEAAGAETGKELVIAGLKELGVKNIAGEPLKSFINLENYNNFKIIYDAVSSEYVQKCIPGSSGIVRFRLVLANRDNHFCQSVWEQTQAVSKTGYGISSTDGIKTAVETIVTKAEEPAKAAAEAAEIAKKLAIETAEKESIEATSTQLYSAIGYSILAILIIVLIMIIIYLVLRYRRKKKMKKKAQYTKLLNQ
ncbi:rifin PIR protein, putative [Plasmodium reichenowi]|uniref:Rifin PIR protein, putative n=1 Tax=Plasmodium reichenowi TaxID=5854 RepID=A0A2P9DKT4_PLARE|nr:rifin PIR protein, putative [Plasmodium reichenowi]